MPINILMQGLREDPSGKRWTFDVIERPYPETSTSTPFKYTVTVEATEKGLELKGLNGSLAHILGPKVFKDADALESALTVHADGTDDIIRDNGVTSGIKRSLMNSPPPLSPASSATNSGRSTPHTPTPTPPSKKR